MKKFLAVLGALALIPSFSSAAPKTFGRGARSGRGMLSGNRSLGSSRAGFAGRSSLKGVSRVGFRNLTGGTTGGTGGTGGTATSTQAPPPTYAMIGSFITSPGMFTTQKPIDETRPFYYIDAGGVHYQQPAIDQNVDRSRGVFTDPTLSGGGQSSGGYGTLFASH